MVTKIVICGLQKERKRKKTLKDASRLWREVQYWVIFVCHQRLLISHYASPCIVGMKILRAAVMWFFYIRLDNCMAVIIICAVPLVRNTLVSTSACFWVRRENQFNVWFGHAGGIHFVPSYIPIDNLTWWTLKQQQTGGMTVWCYGGRVIVGGWTTKERKGTPTENVWLI